MSLRIKVVAFATASDILGKQPAEVELPEGAKLGQLRSVLTERHPALETVWDRLAVAVDGRLARSEDEALEDGSEVALLPPVSGGADAPEDPPVLVDGPIDLATVEGRVRSAGCGAVLLFLGTVRDHHAGRSVDRLTYTAYRPMAETALQRIAEELESAGERLAVRIVHRLGDVPVGEPSVVIAVASPHREAAYEASRAALERLKREVPIWKREHYADGEVVWREEEPLQPSPEPLRV